MSKNTGLLLIVWNVLLTALAAWGLLRKPALAASADEASATEMVADMRDTARYRAVTPRDTAALAEARIAFFFMDTLKAHYDLLKEKGTQVLSTGSQWDKDLKKRGTAIMQKMHDLEARDHTYSTMAEKEAALKEYEDLQEEMRVLQKEQDQKQGELDEMQSTLYKDFMSEVGSFLQEYNEKAGFDYIIHMQEGGQVWVGNEGLDITGDIIQGLNARYHAKKAALKEQKAKK